MMSAGAGAAWTTPGATSGVEVPSDALPRISAALDAKLRDVDADLARVGFQPKTTTHAIFNQCRLFDVAFKRKLSETRTTAMIREAFVGPHGLKQNIKRLQLDTFFAPDHVRRVCRQADGYQPHLVSPEKGLRLLISEAMEHVLAPASQCITDVKMTLINTVRQAADDVARNHGMGSSMGAGG